MTKPRPPLTEYLALTKVAAVLGWAECASIVGRSESTVRHWSDQDCAIGISAAAALQLDIAFVKATGDPVAPFEQWHALALDAASVEVAACARLRAQRAAAAAIETGQAIGAIIAAHAPGAGPAEQAIARRETEEAIGALTAVIADIPTVGGPA